MSLNLAISIDILIRISANVYAIAWTGLIIKMWVLQGPRDIDKRLSALFVSLGSMLNSHTPNDSSFA